MCLLNKLDNNENDDGLRRISFLYVFAVFALCGRDHVGTVLYKSIVWYISAVSTTA